MQDVSIVEEGRNLPQESTKEAERRNLVSSLDKVGLTEDFVASSLKEVIENAYTATPKGEIIPDYASRLAGIKVWHSMRKSSPDIAINIANVFPTGNIL